MLKIMGKKMFTILREKFCLSKPMKNTSIGPDKKTFCE